MAYLLVFLSGVFLACMQSFNGQLNASIGMYATSFFVHVIGGIVLFLYISYSKIIKKEKKKKVQQEKKQLEDYDAVMQMKIKQEIYLQEKKRKRKETKGNDSRLKTNSIKSSYRYT